MRSTGKLTVVKKKPLHSTIISCICLSFLLQGCWGYTKNVDPLPGQGPSPQEIQPEAYVPVYGSDTLLRGIYAMEAQPTIAAGKIYVYGNLLFQVENEKGIHVIDYSDRKKPVKLGFIRCKGSSELAVKGGYLITNNLDDLVTIDISRVDSVKEVARMKHAFTHYNVLRYMDMKMYYPPERGKYYVCPNVQDGDVIGWKLEKNVRNAYCYYN